MLAVVASVLFLLALVFELVGLILGVLTPQVLLTAGLLCLALHLAGFGGSAKRFARRRR